MTAAVSEAREWAEALVGMEFRGPGDTLEAARYRAARRSGVPEKVFFALRYRTPKDIAASAYLALRAAYRAELDRQQDRLRHELEKTKAMLGDGADHDVVASAEAFLRAQEGRQ